MKMSIFELLKFILNLLHVNTILHIQNSHVEPLTTIYQCGQSGSEVSFVPCESKGSFQREQGKNQVKAVKILKHIHLNISYIRKHIPKMDYKYFK